MDIKKKGFLYKFIYGHIFADKPEKEESLCKMVWLIPVALVCWPVSFVVVVSGAGVIAFVQLLVILATGTMLPLSNKVKGPIPIKYWPFKTKDGENIALLWAVDFLCRLLYRIFKIPTLIFVPPLMIWGVYSFSSAFARLSSGYTENVFLLIFNVLFLIMAILGACGRYSKTEWWQVAKAYIDARKKKFCPTVRFVD